MPGYLLAQFAPVPMIKSGSIADIISKVTSVENPRNLTAPNSTPRIIHKQNMSVFNRYLTNCRVDQVHFGLVIIRKLIRLISIIKNPSQQLQAGKIFYVRFCLKSTKLPLSQLEPAVQNTAFCARSRFSSPTNIRSVSSVITASNFHFSL